MQPIKFALATLLGALVMTGVLTGIHPAMAAPGTPLAAISAVSGNSGTYRSMASAAGVASADAAYLAVTRFRPASRQRLTDFLSQYGDRLTPVQLQRARAQVTKADLTLAQLEAKTRATRTLARSGASTARIKQAADAASRAFDSATASTAGAMAEMQPMLSSKLSLFEGLRAKLELDQSMRDFAAVGAAVKAVRP
ncbi:MAG: hypothetical protein F2763_08545 [Actinobacteria bacterium]|uniref:Unannotated protein n=1 Tax=freshwater metagenome TaxID=449393 RepID=A0A6J7ATB6_9ZZZZ|nr:hypothetical protein [Actinomycetota bacterium]